MKPKIGKYNLLFVIALAMAIIGAVITSYPVDQPWWIWVSLVIGVGIGFVNITNSESNRFMIAYLAVAAVSGVFTVIPTLGAFVNNFFLNMLVIYGAGVAVVGLKELIVTSKSK